jgi:hypothetical protein
MAAIQRGPCPKVPAEFDRRPLASARGRLCIHCAAETRKFWVQEDGILCLIPFIVEATTPKSRIDSPCRPAAFWLFLAPCSD